MTSFKRTQRKYVQKAYRVLNWREYETGLRARGSLTVWLGLTDGKLANWNSPRPTRRKPGRQRQYSNHAIETTVTLGLVFGLASRQTEGFLRSLLTLLNLDNDVPDHSTISRRKARLGKVASYERRTVKPVHLRIDSSGLSVHVGQWRTPPKARDYRKLHLAVDEQTSDVVACELTSKRARDASRVASLVGQIERPIASAKAAAAYDTGDVYQTLEHHRAHRSPKVLIPPRKGAQLALDSAGTRQRNRNIRARSRVGKRKWYVASGYSRRSKADTMSTMLKTTKSRRPRRQFDEEFKAGAVRLVLDDGQTVGRVARELDLTESALRTWVDRARADRTNGRTGLTTEEREELRRLRKEIRVLRTEREILKNAAAFFVRENA